MAAAVKSKALALWLRLRDMDLTGMFGPYVVHEDEQGNLSLRTRHSKAVVERIDKDGNVIGVIEPGVRMLP